MTIDRIISKSKRGDNAQEPDNVRIVCPSCHTNVLWHHFNLWLEKDKINCETCGTRIRRGDIKPLFFWDSFRFPAHRKRYVQNKKNSQGNIAF